MYLKVSNQYKSQFLQCWTHFFATLFYSTNTVVGALNNELSIRITILRSELVTQLRSGINSSFNFSSISILWAVLGVILSDREFINLHLTVVSHFRCSKLMPWDYFFCHTETFEVFQLNSICAEARLSPEFVFIIC